MATIVTRYISAGSTGGDGTTTALSGANAAYASIGAWVTARVAANANFVTANVIEKGVCIDNTPFLERPVITGATTDASHYWWLTAWQKNNGTPGIGACIDNQNTATAAVLTLSNGYTVVDSLEIKNMKTNNDSTGYVVRVSGSNLTIDGLLIHNCTTGTTQRPCGVGTTDSFSNNGTIVRNCIVYDFLGCHAATGISVGDSGSWLVYNNTIVNITGNAEANVIGINAGSRTNSTAKNNLVLTVTGGSTSNCFVGTWGTIDHCVSTDTTATGTGSITSVTAANEIVNATQGSENCHLKSGATSIDAGTTIAGFTNDISNNTRPQGSAWDIGADEFIPPPPTRIMRLFEGFKIKLRGGRLKIQQR